jgi:hypothetical protein
MNDDPHLIRCVGPSAAEVAAVARERIAAGPFTEARDPKNAYRRIAVVEKPGGSVLVWENHGYTIPPPSVMAVLLENRFPAATLDEQQLNLGRTPPDGRSLLDVSLDLDDDKQSALFHKFVNGIEARLLKPFPLRRKDGEAQLECTGQTLEWPHEEDGEAFSPQCSLHMSFKLTVHPERKRPHVSRKTFELGFFPVLTPRATFLIEGKERRFAADDLDRQFANQMALRLKLAVGRMELAKGTGLDELTVAALFE